MDNISSNVWWILFDCGYSLGNSNMADRLGRGPIVAGPTGLDHAAGKAEAAAVRPGRAGWDRGAAALRCERNTGQTARQRATGKNSL